MAKGDSKVGKVAFVVGVILAIILGLFFQAAAGATQSALLSILVILGLIVGFLNITGGETNNFLIAAVSILIASQFGGNVLAEVVGLGQYLSGILAAILTFVTAAVIIVALKAIYNLAEA